ncbi:unnamed protein product, partial [Closterium sp. NIES-65]
GGGGGGRDEGKGGSGGEGGEEGGAGGSGETDEERVRREVERVDRARVETGVLLLGRIAESSDLVEDEVSYMPPLFSLHGVLTIIFALFASAACWSCSACPSPLIQVVFLIAAAAALRLVRTNLAAAVLTTAAASLGYPSLSQYLDILLPSVATRWVAADPVLLPLPALAQVVVALEQAGGGRGMGSAGCWTAGGGGRQMLEEKGDHEAGGDTAWVVAAGVGGAGALARAWKRLAPLLLPALLLLGRKSDVQFLAEALQAPVPRLLKESFPHVVAALLPFRQSELDTWQKEAATRVLTTGLLATAGWSEAERDQLLTKHMVPIITSLLQHTSSQQHPSLPSFPTACIRATICTLVDSTADSRASSNSISTSALPSAPPLVSDHLNILRPANVFPLLLALHKAAVAACSPRHRCHIIAALSVLVDILGNRVTVPPTFRYLVHILLACLPTSAPTWPPPAPPLASSQLSLSQSPSCPLPSPSTPAAVAAVCLDVLARVVAAAQSNGAREGGHSGMASAAVLDQSQIPPSPATLSAPPLPLLLQAIVSRLLALCTPPAAEAAVGAAAAGAGGGTIGVAEGGAAAGAARQEGELPEALVELLRAFTVDAPAAVRARLQLFHMPAAAVAAYPSLAPIADSLSSLSHDLPLPQQLAQLASQAIHLSPAVLAQSLEALCNHLASTKHLLWCDETARAAKGMEGAAGNSSRELDAGGPGDGLPRPSAQALTATWQMLQVSQRLSESDPCTSTIRACLGRLLAALGIWDASAVSFKPPATATSTAAPTAASAPTGGVTVVNADPAGEGVHKGVIVSVLKLLATLLVDPDVHAIQLAAQTIEVRLVLALLLPCSCLLKLLSQDPSLFPVASALRLHRVTAILMTERGHRVFTATGFEEKQYLEAHIKTVNTAHAQQIIQHLRADAGASMPPLDDPAVWQAVGASHEVWVCRVVHLLILHAPDDILTLCAPLCSVNASLAALLLPHTLATLAASHAPTSLLCRTISTQLTTHVLQPARAVSPRTLQLLLDALTALRACHTRARMAPPPTAAAAARAAASAMGARKSAAKVLLLLLTPLSGTWCCCCHAQFPLFSSSPSSFHNTHYSFKQRFPLLHCNAPHLLLLPSHPSVCPTSPPHFLSSIQATSAAAPSTTTEASTRTAAGVGGSSSKGKRGGRRGTKKSGAGEQEGPPVGAAAEEAGAAQLRAEEKGAEVDEDEPEAPQHWQSVSLLASLPLCLLASLPPCLLTSLPPCLLASLPPYLFASLPPCLLVSLPLYLLASLPLYLLASLPLYLLVSLPLYLLASLPLYLLASLPLYLLASLSLCLFTSLSLCLFAFLPLWLLSFLHLCLFAFLPPCILASLPLCLLVSLPLCPFSSLPPSFLSLCLHAYFASMPPCLLASFTPCLRASFPASAFSSMPPWQHATISSAWFLPTATPTHALSSIPLHPPSVPPQMCLPYFLPLCTVCVDARVLPSAVQHCGATLTAILYAELWCEAHFGRPTLGEPSFDEDSDAFQSCLDTCCVVLFPPPFPPLTLNAHFLPMATLSSPTSPSKILPLLLCCQVEPHEALLMGCYSAVNEPDAIYAVARTNKLPSRLAINRHEGRWEKVLETLDHAMSHRPAPAGAALSSGATPAVPSLHTKLPGRWASGTCQQLSSRTRPTRHPTRPPPCSYAQPHLTAAALRPPCLVLLLASTPLSTGVLQPPLESGTPFVTLTAPPDSISTTTSAMAMPGGAAAGFHAALYRCAAAVNIPSPSLPIVSSSMLPLAPLSPRPPIHRSLPATIVCQLASTSAESALHINSRLVLLQALENVREAAAPTLARGGGPPIHAGQARHTELHTWQRQLAACGSSFELQEPLLSCRGAYLRASGQHNALPLHLLEAASLCRKARLLSQAAVHVQHLKDACRALTACSHTPTTVPHLPPTSSAATASAEEGTWGVEGVAFCGRVEEAKLLALEGQQDMAVRLLQHLLRPDLPPHASQGSASPSAASAAVTTAAVTTVAASCVPVSDRVYTLGLAAKWLGETRSISSRVVLNDYLWRAVDLTTHPPTASHSASPSAAAAAAATAPPSYASLPFANNWHQQKQERQWKQQQQQQGGYGGQQGGVREQGGQGGQGGEQGQWQRRRQWGEVHFQMARYVDGLFLVLHTRLHSQQWRAAQDLTNHKRKELEEMTKRLKASRREDERRVYGMKMMELQKQLSMDDQEANDLQVQPPHLAIPPPCHPSCLPSAAPSTYHPWSCGLLYDSRLYALLCRAGEHDMYLRAALENYRNCLLAADTFNIQGVFRLTALWFMLLNDATADAVNAEMLTTIQTVPSYKFLPLVYQMASRMSERDPHGSPPLHPETPDFQSVLTTLVKRMADDHPLHTVPVLMALANGNRVRSSQRGRNLFVVDEDKIRAAKAVLGGMAERHKPMLDEMQQLMDLYIRLAEMESSKEDLMRSKQLPRNFRSVRDLLRVPVLTASVPVDRTCCYAPGSFPAFCGLKDSMRVMHGVNAPKVVECVGSDGRVYKQLAKSGNDDLRQDAVMEQLFGLVNSLLQAHKGATKRHLAIRTYKVVPFTPSAGLLEWVDGTLPLGEYLLGSTRKGGAHARYGGSDWPFMTCREVMARESDKRQAFDKVLQNFHPVMRHFFLERFLLPANWFDRRLTYTRSVAATSMVGYVVGLGDRHAMNILVDERSAEVVHIDLGIAFEQGLMLKTPEKVPFRLTRDIIDGMGVSGVEGVFRRCCETVLAVMRENKEALLTIIEVSGVEWSGVE